MRTHPKTKEDKAKEAAEAAHAMKNDKTQRNNAKLLAKAFGCSYAIEYHPECFSDNE